MTTTESNALIAEFMGLSYCDKHNYEGWYTDSEHNYRICDYDGLTYHTNWNLLMKAVTKIELMNKDTGFMGVFTLYGLGRTKVQCYKNEQLCYEVDVIDNNYGMQPTYQAVVKFIEWFNKNK